MPRISSFYGIVIWMYHDESHHLGRPHFHATYSGDEVSIEIESLKPMAGGLPPRAMRLVSEWARAHQAELREKAGTIVWPNDADIAPETLYAHAVKRAAATA